MEKMTIEFAQAAGLNAAETESFQLLAQFTARRIAAGMAPEQALQDADRAIRSGLKQCVYKMGEFWPVFGEQVWETANA